MSFIDGLSTGLDTTSIINQLMQIERRPQVALSTRRSQEEAARTELSGLRSDVTALKNLASDLRLTSGWDPVTAVSSNNDAVSVQATSAGSTGSVTFQVTSLASAASMYSSTEYASLDTVVAEPGASIFQASGYSALGLSNVSGTGFAAGDISLAVTQASAPAEVEGAGIPSIPITVDGTNDGIDFQVNGFSFSITLAHGSYVDETELAAAVSEAIAGDPEASELAAASLTVDNRIKLSTTGEGSAHTLTVTGGTALAGLGLTAAATATGVDGIVELNGTPTTITDTTSAATVTLASGGAGSIDADISGPLRVGTAAVAQTAPGDGTLSDLVSTINNSDLGYSAAAVNTGSGYRLQLTADETGAASAITLDPELYGTMAFTTLSAGSDAQITVQGDNPYSISSSTNTFEGLLPGVGVTVNDTTDVPVTVSTQRDTEKVTDNVEAIVNKVNEILTRIADSTRNQPSGGRSVLQGSQVARRVADQIRNAIVAPLDGNEIASAGSAGIELTREGTLTFNRDRFAEVLQDNPDAVTSLFTDRSDGATPGAQPGVLDRLITAAEMASSTGDGALFTAAESSERRVADYGRQIEAVDRRLELRESTLRRTYANLEVTLGRLQQQSSHLASQLSSLGGF